MAVTDVVSDVPANVELAHSHVTRYDKGSGTSSGWVDTGTLVLRKRALDLLADTPRPTDLGQLFEGMITRYALLAHAVHQPFYDIGTHSRLARFA